MIDLLVIAIIVLIIVLIAVSIIKATAKFMLKLGIFALMIFLVLELMRFLK